MDLSRYMDLFVAEARDHLASASAHVPALAAAEPDPHDVRELFRHLHSIKGTASSMGLVTVSRLAHAAEHLLGALRDGDVPGGERRAALMGEALALLEGMIDHAERGQVAPNDLADRLHQALIEAAGVVSGNVTALPCLRIAVVLAGNPPHLEARAATVLGRLEALGRIARSEPPRSALRAGLRDRRLSVLLMSDLPAERIAASLAGWPEVEVFTIAPASAPAWRPAAAPHAWVRVRADRLDRVVGLTRALARDLARLEARLEGSGDAAARAHAARARLVARRVRAESLDLRGMSFGAMAARLVEGAEQLARRLGKSIRFDVDGKEIRADRTELEPLLAPLLHLLTNAVDHGIEPPSERRRAGKHPTGRVRLAIARRPGALTLRVEDDGRGLDPAALRRRAVEMGLVTSAQAADLDLESTLRLVTIPGFTTASTVTEVSGRGVGLDVVRDAVASLGGRLDIVAPKGRGTVVELTVPPRPPPREP